MQLSNFYKRRGWDEQFYCKVKKHKSFFLLANITFILSCYNNTDFGAVLVIRDMTVTYVTKIMIQAFSMNAFFYRHIFHFFTFSFIMKEFAKRNIDKNSIRKYSLFFSCKENIYVRCYIWKYVHYRTQHTKSLFIYS